MIEFNGISEQQISGADSQEGALISQIYSDEQGKTIFSRLQPGGVIETRKVQNSDAMTYILSGKGRAICDGREESLFTGYCHICKDGSEHSIINTGSVDLVMLTVVIGK